MEESIGVGGAGVDRSGAAPDSSFVWQPCGGAFQPYYPLRRSSTNTLQAVVRRPLVLRLTKDIVETYQKCNPNFKYSEALNPKRFLTNPSVGVLNDGHDNVNSDLILHVNLVLVGSNQRNFANVRYIVKDILGQGTFGQVAKCWVPETNNFVAVKIIKNQPAYYQQALVEVSLLTMLNQKYDPDDKNHIVRILDYFVCQRHLCISFEMLGSNLYELIRINHFKGLSLSIVQVFSKQILQALIVMKDAGIIHCDLKPENVLISASVKPAEIKVIDFGSACLEGRTVYSYIQSRYYRSPEVLLGYPYTTAIDMWSFGCIVAELFLGLPLFPGASEFDLLKRMIEILGGQPPDELLRDAKNTSKFFKHVGSIYRSEDDEGFNCCESAYRVLSEDEYEVREAKKPVIGKRYFNYIRLEDIVGNYPYRKNLADEEVCKENLTRMALVDFLRGLVEFDPGKRWSPLQASRHPFVTGEPFTCPYKPPPETPRIPVLHTVTVDHHPGGGHWLAAGLSPHVSHVNKCLPQNNPHFQMAPMSHGTSYGSVGSHGSYNDNAGLGSSYGSYGDVSNMYTFYSPVGPSGLHMQAQLGGSLLGSSPDTRRRPQMSHGNGFGLSPSAGGFGPMSLGASPSQFTPPSSQMHISTVSPGKYGPTSPARGSVHGSPLGKAAAVGQYNRRRNWGCSGSFYMQSHESASHQWQGSQGDGVSCSQPDAFARGHGSSPRSTLAISNYSNWRSQRGAGNGLSLGPSTDHQNFPASCAVNSNLVNSQSSEVSSDKPECSSSPPDPADWDPYYSDEQLLQDGNAEVNSLAFSVTNSMHLAHTMESTASTSGAGRFSYAPQQAYMSSNSVSSNQRMDGMFRTYADGSPPSGHDAKPGYSRPPHFPHNSPSRFGQQPLQQFNLVHSASIHNERHQPKGHPHRSNYSITDQHSPANSLFGNGITWGRRSGHPIATARPSSHARKDFGRIS